MGYTDKLQKLLALRGLDQSALALKVSLSKSSISRILSGTQEPKLRLAYSLAKALGVTLDYLVDETPEVASSDQLVMVTEDELTILKMVRRLGTDIAIDRLLNVAPATADKTAAGGVEASPQTTPTNSGTRARDYRRGDDR